jgi:YqaJ-like recombinase protein
VIVHQCIQGSEEWLALRLGVVTASEFDSILTPKELGLSKSSKKYMALKLAEWMAGMPLEVFEDRPEVRGWRERGKLLEPEAVRYYEMERDCETSAVGFISTDDGMIGCSPDRLIGDPGLLEIKCPALETHVGYMLDPGSLVAEYRLQTQGQMWVSGRHRGDIMSYYPGFPAVIVPLKPEEKVFAALSQHIPAFVDTMLKCRERLTQEYGELRRERVTAEQRTAASHAAFEEFMGSGIGGAV